MRVPFAFLKTAAGGGAVAVVSGVSYSVVDIAGGGQRVVVTVDSSTGCTSIAAGGVAFTSFAIDDGTHVSGIPGAHAAGAVAVVVTNATGPSTTGGTPLEYWSPAQITSISGSYDAEKGVTGSPVSAWADQSAAGLDLAQATGAQQPVYTSNAFGTLHGLTFDAARVMKPASWQNHTGGRSVFWVGKYTSTDATSDGYSGNNPLTVVGDSSGSVNVNAGHSTGSLSYQNYDAGWVETTRGSAENDDAAHLFGWTHSSGGDLKAYVGATQQGSTAAGQTYAGTSGWDSIGQGYGGFDGFVGTLGSVVIVDGIISGGDLTKLNNWAGQRWGAT
jgi:hypothetical protein